MIFAEPRFSPLGDSAVTITLGDEISAAMSDRVIDAAVTIESGLRGVVELVPTYAAVTLFYDSVRVSYSEIVRAATRALNNSTVLARKDEHLQRVVRIPVTYDGQDLTEVAQRTGMTEESVIDMHCLREYRVYMLGFAPGFAYLGDLDQRLALPRRESPRKRVSKGSVAIADAQTAVYPSSTPGGWHLIGRTEMTMFDPTRDPPATLAVGDRVRFERIGR